MLLLLLGSTPFRGLADQALSISFEEPLPRSSVVILSKVERPPRWALCGVRWQSEAATPLWPGAERPGCRVSALRLPKRLRRKPKRRRRFALPALPAHSTAPNVAHRFMNIGFTLRPNGIESEMVSVWSSYLLPITSYQSLVTCAALVLAWLV